MTAYELLPAIIILFIVLGVNSILNVAFNVPITADSITRGIVIFLLLFWSKREYEILEKKK